MRASLSRLCYHKPVFVCVALEGLNIIVNNNKLFLHFSNVKVNHLQAIDLNPFMLTGAKLPKLTMKCCR